MDRGSVLNKLTEIFEDVLDEEVELTEKTTALDIEEWDSLNNVQIIFKVEKEYGIKFSAIEIQSFKSIADLVSAVVEKKSA